MTNQIAEIIEALGWMNAELPAEWTSWAGDFLRDESDVRAARVASGSCYRIVSPDGTWYPGVIFTTEEELLLAAADAAYAVAIRLDFDYDEDDDERINSRIDLAWGAMERAIR